MHYCHCNYNFNSVTFEYYDDITQINLIKLFIIVYYFVINKRVTTHVIVIIILEALQH